MAHHNPIGTAVHKFEKEAIDFLVQNLPGNYVVFSNVELATGRPGQTFEHDAIVLSPHAVFTVEIKSWGGTIRGNRDRWTLDDGTMWHSPIPPTQSKARVLKGRLKARRADLSRVWVQGVVFLSAADADPHISPDYADLVTTRRDVIKALTDPTWFHLQDFIRPGQKHAIEMFLADGRPRQISDRLGKFELLEQLDAEDKPYDAWVGREPLGGNRHVLHVHTLAADDEEEREILRKAALREATLHQRLRGGPNILRYDSYSLEDDPQRIVLQFEDTTPLQPLPGWVDEHQPGLITRLRVAHEITRAVAWVHKRKVVLRGLTPDHVLVSPDESADEVRLCAFDVARDTSAGTHTIVGGSSITALRTSAPEVLKSGIADELSDLFSLGATLYELFAGRKLFDSLDAILQPFTVPQVDVGGRRLPPDVHTLLARLLDTRGTERPRAEEALEILAEALRAQTRPTRSTELVPGAEIRSTFELEERLGRGATATTWKAHHLQTGQTRVLKIGSSESAEMLALECKILTEVQHGNLVRAYDVGPDGDRQVLVIEWVDGLTGRLVIEAGDPPTPASFGTAAKGLLAALQALHDAGWLHRDVKPENVMFRSEDGLEPVLLDLGLACRTDTQGDLTVGTPRYKDPLVYREGCWSRANDIYAAHLMLAELLTGAHPFGDRAPDDEHQPEVPLEEVPDAFPAAMAKDLVSALCRGLSVQREQRVSDATEAWAVLECALGGQPAEASPTREPTTAPSAGITPATPVRDLPLSVRAQGALSRLQIRTAAQLAGLEPKAARRLPNVGAKTVRELRRWVEDLRQRWPELAPAAPAPEPELYPALRHDDRPLTVLGNALSPHFREQFAQRNIRTVGHLASSTEATLLAIPRFGDTKLDALRDALARLAGSHAPPASLRALDERLQEELGPKAHAYLAAVVGLHDGLPRGLAEVAELFGVSRQRIDQAVSLDPLRADASEAGALNRLVQDILPPAGLAPVAFVAQALAERLGEEPAISAVGFALLGALLLDPERRASHASQVTVVHRPPWTAEAVEEATLRLTEATRWPYRRGIAEREAWEALPEALRVALVRRGCDPAQLLTALLRLVDEVTIDPYGALYVPPLELEQILREHRADLLPQSGPVDAQRILEIVQESWQGVRIPTDLDQALEAAGWKRDNGRWYDPGRYQPAQEPEAPVVDPEVPRQGVATSLVPPVVQALVSAAEVGGFRVVAMPPGKAHEWTEQLVTWLQDAIGDARPVRRVQLDRVVLQALKDSELWAYVPYQEQARAQDQDWSWAHEPVEAALEQELGVLGRGSVTVLGDPSLLGTLGLMHWLSGFYERARGGRHGLIVLALPGGVHDNRVRLNERYNLPYTPDMAAVYLDEVRP
jgi:serine/threonine protein kinase